MRSLVRKKRETKECKYQVVPKVNLRIWLCAACMLQNKDLTASMQISSMRRHINVSGTEFHRFPVGEYVA